MSLQPPSWISSCEAKFCLQLFPIFLFYIRDEEKYSWLLNFAIAGGSLGLKGWSLFLGGILFEVLIYTLMNTASFVRSSVRFFKRAKKSQIVRAVKSL